MVIASSSSADELSPTAATRNSAALTRRLRAVGRRGRLEAVGLTLPLLVFLSAAFLVPIGLLLIRAVDNREIGDVLPRTAAVLRAWNRGSEVPPDAFTALADDLKGSPSPAIADVARRLNFYDAGLRSKIMKAATTMAVGGSEPRTMLIAADPAWATPRIWIKLKQASPRFTAYYFLRALDLDYDDTGAVVARPDRIYTEAMLRTLGISAGVTILCLLLGYPLAYLMASVSERVSGLLGIFLLLPFWTSLLVRTTAWLVLLQKNGVVNSILLRIGAIAEPLALAYNRIGVFIAMTHILLPFAVLPILAVMKGVSPAYQRAASSLGANPWRGFLHVYLPLTLPGIGAGGLLVFILALGYYITPALVGGPGDQMLSSFIAFFVNQSTNWSMAAALACILLFAVATLYAVLAIATGRRGKALAS